jgi:hypothetical protein
VSTGKQLGKASVAAMASQVRRFIHYLSRIFMEVPAAPHIPALFPIVIERFHVTDWSALIRALPDADLCMVKSIELMKACQSKQHEYLLIRACHPNSLRPAIFIADRCPSTKVTIRSFVPSQSQPSEYSSPFSPPVASDTVTISPDADEWSITVKQHGPSETLSTLTFSVTRPSVLDLATLFEVVNTHAPYYTGEYQCYWYSGETFDIMKLEFGANETHNALAKLERSSYKGFSVGTKDSTAILQAEFRERRKIYASEREAQRNAREAPIIAVSGCKA